MDSYIGEIRAFCFNFVPSGWALCDGARMSISENEALYSLIGATYGPSDGVTYFSLPNLQGMAPICTGQTINAEYLPPAIQPGETFGAASVTLNTSQIAAHTHQVYGGVATSASAMTQMPAANSLLSRPMQNNTAYLSFSNQDQPNTQMAAQMIQPSGGSQPHENMQPFLALNFCICLDGEYPVPE